MAEKRTQNQIDFNKIGLKKPKNSTLDSKENLDLNQNEMNGQEKDPNKDFTNFNLLLGESISQFDHNSVITQRKENDDDRPKILFNNDKESQITRYPHISEQYDYQMKPIDPTKQYAKLISCDGKPFVVRQEILEQSPVFAMLLQKHEERGKRPVA